MGNANDEQERRGQLLFGTFTSFLASCIYSWGTANAQLFQPENVAVVGISL
jgi:hypothetical protein